MRMSARVVVTCGCAQIAAVGVLGAFGPTTHSLQDSMGALLNVATGASRDDVEK